MSCRKGLLSVTLNVGVPHRQLSEATKRGGSSDAAEAWHCRSSSTNLEGKVGKSTRMLWSVLIVWNSSSEMSSVYSRYASDSSVSWICSTFWLRGCVVL